MKVLLHTDIPELGYFGDVVEVKDGYARNYLIPQSLAVEPNEANIQRIAEERAAKAEVRRLAHEQLVKVAEGVNGAEVTIEALANEQGHLFGSVSENDVAEALRQKGFEVQAKQVKIAEHFRQLDTYQVTLHFAQDIEATVAVEVVRPTDPEDDAESESRQSQGEPTAEPESEPDPEQV